MENPLRIYEDRDGFGAARSEKLRRALERDGF